jgi:hypothetical protein
MREPAKVKVQYNRQVSPEASALSRQLATKLRISANQLAERAIYALAAAIDRQRDQQST